MTRLCLIIVVAGLALLVCAALAYAGCGQGCKHDATEKTGCKEDGCKHACEPKGEGNPEYTGVVESVDIAKGEFALKVDGTGDVVSISLGELDPDGVKEGQDLRVIYKKQEARVAQRIIKRRHLILPKPCVQ